MWPNRAITQLFKISSPMIQAPMAGGITSPELVAAVSNAGCLGSLGAGYMAADEIRKTIKEIRKLTNNSFSINLFIPEKHHVTEERIEQARSVVQASCRELNFKVDVINPPYAPDFEAQMKVVLEEKVPIVSFTFGIPSQHWIDIFKRNGIKIMGTATSLAEAKLLEACGMDAIVAQGSEAGGHRSTFFGAAEDSLHSISSLVPLLVEQVKIPVIAAGGIMDGRGIVASLKSGASAVQMGTAFLCCSESGAHPFYKKLLLNTVGDNTVLTRAFSGKLARGINNQFIMRMREHEKDILEYPIHNKLTSAMRKEAGKQNNIDFMSMWAGQSARLCRAEPAALLIQGFIGGVGEILK